MTLKTSPKELITPKIKNQLNSLAGRQLRQFVDMLARNRTRFEDDNFLAQGLNMLAQTCGNNSTDTVKLLMLRQLTVYQKQREELIAVLKSLRKQIPVLAWVLSRDFAVNGDGKTRRFVYALPLGRAGIAAECFQIMEPIPGDNGKSNYKPQGYPDPPFLGVIDPINGIFLGPSELPLPPIRGDIHQVVNRCPPKFNEIAELELSDAVEERRFTVFASCNIANEIEKRMNEDGESLSVRVENGVATGIHLSKEQRHEDWLEFPLIDGPKVTDLIFPAVLRREWGRDIYNISRGKSVRICLVGPTGMGKTSAAERVGRDAMLLAKKDGIIKKGFALIRISSAHIGSSFIHQTERNLFKVFKRAQALAKQNYVVVVLWDEADALLGEIDSPVEHSHNRSERLVAQSLLTEPTENVAVYLTMNARRNSWLPSAIDRRFLKRVYGRATRSQLEAVVQLYISECPKALKKLQMSEQEFAGAFVDNLYSDQRIVANVYLYSGDKLQVRARDLHNCSPGKAKDLILRFRDDVCDGEAISIDSLWTLFDREFRAPNLNARNLSDLTFLRLPPTETIRQVELLR